ncbi:MAG: lysine--tRNA ligase [Patescibacteria group bacterium]
MIWVDRELNKIKKRKFEHEWVDDMKTPSGRIHVGSLRGVLVHDLIYKVMIQNGLNTRFSYVFNDMDPMDAIPAYLEKKIWEKYSGKPLFMIPSPEKGYKSFAEYYAKEFIEVFNTLNCHPLVIWSHNLYQSGQMNDIIKTVLDNADKVRDIYKKVTKTEKKTDWIPFNPICEKCGNIGTTNSHKWDGHHVYYRCEENIVSWAKGCGHEGMVSPYDGKGKLPWKLDWPAHWKVIGVTIESSGKDHMSSGGSYDMGKHICEEIFNRKAPYAMGGYEWFTIGGRKMSSSKGIGTSAKEVTQILPPEIFRFFLVRTPISTHLDFNPYGETIPNLFDEYDRCISAYYDKKEGRIPHGKKGEVVSDFARIIELSQVRPLIEKRYFLPRFRTVANILKNKGDAKMIFENQLGRSLSSEEVIILEERISYAKIYLEKYAENQKIQSVQVKAHSEPNDLQKKFLYTLANNLEKLQKQDRESIQDTVFETMKSLQLKPKDVFSAFYQVLTGKQFGPKAADLIVEIGLSNVVAKLNTTGKQTQEKPVETFQFPVLNDRKIFSIHPQVKKMYPTINIGIAVIKGAVIQKQNEKLTKEKENFLKTQEVLTNEIISSYPEVQAYRKLYRQMKVDWHSRRPSPEALLRRIALKKGLYQVNTCVDAYNLIVMNRRVSVGAFDLDKVQFPTILRFPLPNEQILLLGDKEPTTYKSTELAYFDALGGYNIDFNYRDAVRTMVTEKTKNILINIDGIYDITRIQVEQSLKETIEIVTKYCGGTVSLAAIAE